LLNVSNQTGYQMGYPTPILKEIYSEIWIEQNILTPPVFFEVVPKLKEIKLNKVEFGEVVGIALHPKRTVEQQTVPRVRCWSDSQENLVQLSPNIVVVNQLHNYKGWKAFREFFENVLNTLKPIVTPNHINSISLNTVDILKTPRKDFSFERYLNCDGPNLPKWYKGFSGSCDLTMGKGFKPEGKNMLVHLTSIFHDKLKTSGNWQDLLEQLHQESNHSFESLITDETRLLMDKKPNV